MFSELISHYTQKTLEYVKSYFRIKINTALNENEIQNHSNRVKRKANDIVYEAQTAKQTEMVNKALKTRQDEIDRKLKPENEKVREAKGLTKLGVHKTLLSDKTKEDNNKIFYHVK